MQGILTERTPRIKLFGPEYRKTLMPYEPGDRISCKHTTPFSTESGIPTMIPEKRDTFLGEILVQAGLLDEAGLQRGLERQRETEELLGEALVALGVVSQEDIEWALSSQYQLPFVRPCDISVDRSCREIVPETLARAYNVAPLFRTGNELSVVIDDPLKLETLASLSELASLDLNIALGSAVDVAQLINDLYGPLGDASREPVESSRIDAAELAPYLRDFSGATFVDFLLKRASSLHATTLSFDPGSSFGEARLRTGPTVHESYTIRSDWYRTLVRAVWSMTGEEEANSVELREAIGRAVSGSGSGSGSGEMSFAVTRISRPQGDSLLLKLPVGSPALPDLKDLHLPVGSAPKIATLLARGQGLWIVSGNPPAATSRVLHTMLQAMLGPGRRFLSLREDSRGYEKLSNFRSLQVIDAAESRDRYFLPGDVEWDGIVLPSLFDKAEIERALRFALTGRMVIASMDFPDPRSVIRYLLCHDVNVALVTSALSGVLVQKEVRVLCSHCKKRIDSTSRLPLPRRAAAGEPMDSFRPVGCEVCRLTGFSSQDTLLDFWAMDGDLKRILHGPDAVARLEDHGGAVLEDACLERLKQGNAMLEDVLSVCEI